MAAPSLSGAASDGPPTAHVPHANGVADGPAAGAKIGEVTADGRIATLVGYVSAGRHEPAATAGAAAAHGRRRARRQQPPSDRRQLRRSRCGRRTPVADLGRHRGPLATPPVRKLAKDLGIDLRSVTPPGRTA